MSEIVNEFELDVVEFMDSVDEESGAEKGALTQISNPCNCG